MRVLVVTAHPLAASLTMTLAKAVLDELQAAGHELRHQNLYEEEFQPVLTPAERLAFYADGERHPLDEQAESLRWAEALVLVFPTWWFGFPAILKGWFDRVWAPGVAYENAADLGSIKPRLLGLKRALAITTLGSPWWVDRLVMRQPVRRTLKTGILHPCAPHCRFSYLAFYGCEKLSPETVGGMVAKAAAAARKMVSG